MEATNWASPFLVVRPGGNIMVGVPSFDPGLADGIAALGGVDYLIMTDKTMTGEDMSYSSEEVPTARGAPRPRLGHHQWKAAFPGLSRVMHRHDLMRGATLGAVEQVLDGAGPWDLEGGPPEGASEASAVANTTLPDVRIVHTPGVTYGTLCVWCRSRRASPAAAAAEGGHGDGGGGTGGERGDAVLFSGGHIRWDSSAWRADRVVGYPGRAGLAKQAASMRKVSGVVSSSNTATVCAGAAANGAAATGAPANNNAAATGGSSNGVSAAAEVARPSEVPAWQWLLPAFGSPHRFASPAEAGKAVLDAADRCATDPRRLV